MVTSTALDAEDPDALFSKIGPCRGLFQVGELELRIRAPRGRRTGLGRHPWRCLGGRSRWARFGRSWLKRRKWWEISLFAFFVKEKIGRPARLLQRMALLLRDCSRKETALIYIYIINTFPPLTLDFDKKPPEARNPPSSLQRSTSPSRIEFSCDKFQSSRRLFPLSIGKLSLAF
jgi:hypothetical protein